MQTQCTFEPESGELGLRLSTSERLDPSTIVDVSWGVVSGEEGGGAADDAATVHLARIVGDGSGTISGEVSTFFFSNFLGDACRVLFLCRRAPCTGG